MPNRKRLRKTLRRVFRNFIAPDHTQEIEIVSDKPDDADAPENTSVSDRLDFLATIEEICVPQLLSAVRHQRRPAGEPEVEIQDATENIVAGAFWPEVPPQGWISSSRGPIYYRFINPNRVLLGSFPVEAFSPITIHGRAYYATVYLDQHADSWSPDPSRILDVRYADSKRRVTSQALDLRRTILTSWFGAWQLFVSGRTPTIDPRPRNDATTPKTATADASAPTHQPTTPQENAVYFNPTIPIPINLDLICDAIAAHLSRELGIPIAGNRIIFDFKQWDEDDRYNAELSGAHIDITLDELRGRSPETGNTAAS
jgi:hypothetical protein